MLDSLERNAYMKVAAKRGLRVLNELAGSNPIALIEEAKSIPDSILTPDIIEKYSLKDKKGNKVTDPLYFHGQPMKYRNATYNIEGIGEWDAERGMNKYRLKSSLAYRLLIAWENELQPKKK